MPGVAQHDTDAIYNENIIYNNNIFCGSNFVVYLSKTIVDAHLCPFRIPWTIGRVIYSKIRRYSPGT